MTRSSKRYIGRHLVKDFVTYRVCPCPIHYTCRTPDILSRIHIIRPLLIEQIQMMCEERRIRFPFSLYSLLGGLSRYRDCQPTIDLLTCVMGYSWRSSIADLLSRAYPA